VAYNDCKNLEFILKDYLMTYLPSSRLEVRVCETVDRAIQSDIVISSTYHSIGDLIGTKYQHIAEDLIEPIADAIKRSKYTTDLKTSYEKEIELLREENSKLLEALTTGEEYVDTVLTSGGIGKNFYE